MSAKSQDGRGKPRTVRKNAGLEGTGAGVAATADQLHSMAIHLLRRLRKEDAASGLTAPQLSALSVLVFGGPRSLSALAAAEQVRLPTVSRLIKDMERDGLVSRRADRGDRRVQVVRATARGKRLMLAGRQKRLARLVADLSRLADDELAVLDEAAAILQRLVSATKQD